MGLENHLVGITHECDYPATVSSIPRVTSSLIPAPSSSQRVDALVSEHLASGKALYALDHQLLEQLRPDLIITQGLCDVCAVAEDEVRLAARRIEPPPTVLSVQPTSLAGVFEAIRSIAAATGHRHPAGDLLSNLETRVEQVRTRSKQQVGPPPRVAFLEWLDPLFCGGHWNPELVRFAGGTDVLGREGQPSRRLDFSEVTRSNPDVVFIACCGYDVSRTAEDMRLLSAIPDWESLEAVRKGRVFLADGSSYFNRPGPRLVDSLEILAHALAPEDHPQPSETAVRFSSLGVG